MARRRMIDPNIWQSEDFARLSQLAKLLFIGMFSLADDEGKGRAKPVYLKSIVFPYDEELQITDVEQALSEIDSIMSVTFYTHDGSAYYSMTNWSKWQRVDKPQPSKIPNPPTVSADGEAATEQAENDSGIIPEQFSPKRKEEKRREDNYPPKPPQGGDAEADAVFGVSHDELMAQQERNEYAEQCLRRYGFRANDGIVGKALLLIEQVGKERFEAALDAANTTGTTNWKYVLKVATGAGPPGQSQAPRPREFN